MPISVLNTQQQLTPGLSFYKPRDKIAYHTETDTSNEALGYNKLKTRSSFCYGSLNSSKDCTTDYGHVKEPVSSSCKATCNKTDEEPWRNAGPTQSAGKGDATISRPMVIDNSETAVRLVKSDLRTKTGANVVEQRIEGQNSHQLPDYSIEANRLLSFSGSWSEHFPVRPLDLAMAGLYFTGPNDRVQCAFCRGGLYNWEQGDAALTEHRRHFPDCEFIKSNFDAVMKRYLDAKEDVESASNVDRCRGIVNKLGYDISDIDFCINRLKQTGEPITVSNIIDALSEDHMQSPTSESHPDHQSDCSIDSPVDSDSTIPQTKDLVQSGSIQSLEPLSKSQLEEIQQENKSLSEKVTCKVCFSEEVNEVFLPCRHLVCCEGCSKEVNKCPICRTKIAATVKAFMS